MAVEWYYSRHDRLWFQIANPVFSSCMCINLGLGILWPQVAVGPPQRPLGSLDRYWESFGLACRHGSRCCDFRCLFWRQTLPLSDTTNLAPAMAGSELFTHIVTCFIRPYPYCDYPCCLLFWDGVFKFRE